MNNSQIHSEHIEDMIAVAREVGDMAQKMRINRHELETATKSDGSIVTMADKKAEDIIRDRLVKKYGGGFTGEERGKTPDAQGGDKEWVVDPVDGTGNFSAGSADAGNHPSDPNWGVSIAFKDKNKVTHAVVYFPATREICWAEAGKGAHVIDNDGNEKRLRLQNKVAPKTSIEIGGKFPNMDSRKMSHNLQDVYEKMTGGRARNIGTTVFGLTHVATGARGAYIQGNVHEYDYAASAFIAEQAGAKVFIQPVKGDETGLCSIICAHPQVHKKLVDCFKGKETSQWAGRI